MKTARPSPWRRALPAAGLLALGAYLLPAVFLGLAAAWGRVHAARTEVRDDAWAALARQRGKPYADGIARIREALPEDSEYLIIENDGAGDAAMIVRFDLAPRRAIFGGNARDLRANVTPAKLPSLPRWTVIPSVADPGPRLVETRLLAERGAPP